MKKSICIIPARKGSKRIKNKNIKFFFGKPIIYYSIKTALKSKLFKKIYVSTDSKKIQKLSIKFGAECNNLREKKFASDKTKTFKVIKNFLAKIDNPPEIICCLYPAAPFVKIDHLKKAYEILKTNKFLDMVIPVSEFSNSPLRSLKIQNKFIYPNNLNYFDSNSNSLSKVYYDTGSFYMLRSKFIKKSKSFFPSKSYPFIVPKNKFVDLNDKQDWSLAVKLFR